MRAFLITATITALLSLAVPSSAEESEASCSDISSVIPLCAVISDAADYDGKEITVRATYRMVLHGSVLMSAECSNTLVNMRRSLDEKPNKKALAIIRSATKHDRFNPVDLVVQGTFRLAPDGRCFGQNCLIYEFEEHQLVCAQPARSASDKVNKPR